MNRRTANPDRTLPCGRTVGALLDLVAEGAHGPDARALREHARACPHCSGELAELTDTWHEVRETAAEPIVPPPGMVQRTLRALHGIRGRRSADPVTTEQPGGRLQIADRVVVLLARELAGEIGTAIGGVHVRGTASEPEGLCIDVAVRYPQPAAVVGDRLRVELGTRLTEQLGAAAPAVFVRVTDVV